MHPLEKFHKMIAKNSKEIKPSHGISKISEREYWLTIEKGGAMKNQTIILKAKNFKEAQKEVTEILKINKNEKSNRKKSNR